MSLWPRTVKILISNWPRTRKFSPFFKNKGGEDLFLPRSRVSHALRPIFMLWLVKILQVSSCGKFMYILKLVYFDSWSWQSFVSTCDVFNCLNLFLLDVQNEIQLLSRVFCYPWLICLLGFWWRNESALTWEKGIAGDSTLLRIQQGEKRKRCHPNTDFQLWQATHLWTKKPINNLAMNNRRLLIAAVFHFVHPVEKDS